MIRARVLSVALLLTGLATTASADWTDTVFPVKKHDFGTVAVAAKTEFRFPIHNTTAQTIHIRDVRASCGCTTPIIETPYIEPNQTGSVLARFNTGTFRGKRGATLTVVIDQPYYTEVRLRVDGYIRQDMVVHPGAVEFGQINAGDSHEKTVQILYAGRDDWSVVDVLTNKPWMIAEAKQESRGPQRATYNLTVRLDPSAPAGPFQDEVIVVTNDKSMPRVPVRVSGDVQSALTVSPQSITLDAVKPGEPVSKQLVVRGREPFVIERIELPGFDVSFEPITTAKATHVFSATFTPNAEFTGERTGKLIVVTSGSEPLTATALVTSVVRDK